MLEGQFNEPSGVFTYYDAQHNQGYICGIQGLEDSNGKPMTSDIVDLNFLISLPSYPDKRSYVRALIRMAQAEQLPDGTQVLFGDSHSSVSGPYQWPSTKSVAFGECTLSGTPLKDPMDD